MRKRSNTEFGGELQPENASVFAGSAGNRRALLSDAAGIPDSGRDPVRRVPEAPALKGDC